MNPKIHQYRVSAPVSSETIFAQATARVTTFSFPLFCLSSTPPGRLYPVASFATQPWCYGKSVNEKLPRPADSFAFAFSVSLALSGFTVSVCREVYTNRRRTSSTFFEIFAFFLISLYSPPF